MTAYIKFIAHRAFCTPLRLAALAVLGTSTFALAEPEALSGPALRAACLYSVCLAVAPSSYAQPDAAGAVPPVVLELA